MTQKEFGLPFKDLCEFYNWTPNPTQLKYWFKFFEKFKAEDFREAVEGVMVNEEPHLIPSMQKVYKYLPKPFPHS